MLLDLKVWWARILPELKKISTWVKSIGAMMIGGGINSIVAVYTAGVTIQFDHEGLRTLRNTFLSGCVVSLFMYWTTNSPFKKQQQ